MGRGSPRVRRGTPRASPWTTSGSQGDQLYFNLVNEGQKFSFEGRVRRRQGQENLGSFLLGRLVPAEMEPTKLASLDPYEVAKETISKGEPGPEFFQAALAAERAAAKKATPEEVRSWANKAFAAAEVYGQRWQREMSLSIANILSEEESFAPLALEYARKARRLIDASEPVTSQMRVLDHPGLDARQGRQEGRSRRDREGSRRPLPEKDAALPDREVRRQSEGEPAPRAG